jgi:hypothetical protein
MATTTLSTIINRMNRYQTLATIAEVYKVQDLDEAIRTVKRKHKLPFLAKLGSLRVFPDVLLYPVAADHDYLIYLDTDDDTVPYGERMRMRYTSLQQFYEDLDYRNTVAEIWDTNTLMLGIRDKNVPPGFLSSSQLLDNASSISNYTASLDASGLVLDTVNFVDSANTQSSVRFTNTNTTNQALVEWTFAQGSFTDANYQQKYFFVYVYMTGVPISVQLRFGADSSNYLHATVTSQFSSQAFKVNAWNLLAFDLNTATTVGTVNTSTVFNYGAVRLNTAPTGTYNIDTSYSRGWALLDYWYYSKWPIQSDGASAPDKQFFIAANGTYSTDDSLIGDDEWVDVVMYEAMLRSLGDKENETLYAKFVGFRDEAQTQMMANWPDSKPLQIDQSYRFRTEYGSDGLYPG